MDGLSRKEKRNSVREKMIVALVRENLSFARLRIAKEYYFYTRVQTHLRKTWRSHLCYRPRCFHLWPMRSHMEKSYVFIELKGFASMCGTKKRFLWLVGSSQKWMVSLLMSYEFQNCFIFQQKCLGILFSFWLVWIWFLENEKRQRLY